jgi:hypothetical protein
MVRNKGPERGLALLIAAGTLYFFAYNASYNFWWGGAAVGPRFLVPLLPFVTFPIIFAIKRWVGSPVLRLLLIVLAAASFFNVWAQTIAGQTWLPDGATPDKLFSYKMNNPLLDDALPLLMQGDVRKNFATVLRLPGLLSVVPLLVVVLAIYLLVPRLMKRFEKRVHERNLRLETGKT